MTDREKNSISCMRRRGLCYRDIARALGKPEGTVKTYCKRNSLRDLDLQALFEAQPKFDMPIACKKSGDELIQIAGRKPKQFCSDACRLSWWNSHRNEVYTKSVHRLVCASCSKQFSDYDPNRKFCSHPCYIHSRFGGNPHDVRSAEA